MALSSSIVWEVQTTGVSTNGGGFKSGASGTDLSTGAATGLTDMVIDGVTNTKITSAIYQFDATDVGNIINVTGGAGFTTGRYEIASVTGTTATLDRAVGTVGSTGGTGNIGGPLRDIVDGDAAYAGGHTIYVQSGTYTRTTTQTLTADGTQAAGNIHVIGYLSGGSRTDADIIEGSMPILTSATNSIALVTLNAANFWSFRNLKFTHTAGTRGNGIVGATGQTISGPTIQNCVFDGILAAIDTGTSAANTINSVVMVNCAIRNWTSTGINHTATPGSLQIHGCDLTGGAGHCVTLGSTTVAANFTATDSLFRGATSSGDGIRVVSTTATTTGSILTVKGCVFEGNGGAGIKFSYTTGRHVNVLLGNNIFFNNTGADLNCATAGIMDGKWPVMENNASGSNAARTNVRVGDGDITLTADPFTSKGGGNDYTLNSATGGGKLLRQLGWPTTIGIFGATTTSKPDVGASQATTGAIGRVTVGGLIQ